MTFQDVKSYKELELLLKESSRDSIRSNFKYIQALMSALNEKRNITMEKWNVDLEDKKFFEGSFEQKFSEFKDLLPSFKEELDSMVQCAKLTWNKDVLESITDETINNMIGSHEKLREHGLKQLDAIYNLLRLFANPHEVLDEYKELEKQNPQPVPSSRGCMVVVMVLIISVAFAFC